METVYCAACGKVMSAAALACPDCGHPNQTSSPIVAATPATPRGLTGPLLSNASPPMPFGEAIRSFFRNYATFSGRARRSEYWYAVLFLVIISFPFSILDAIVNPAGDFGIFTLVSWLITLGTVIPSLAVASRRLHDADTSFGYYFMFLIPVVGAILLIIKLAEDGSPGANRFGESTKYVS